MNTPRTDEAIVNSKHRYQKLYPHTKEFPVHHTFAQQLELELDIITRYLTKNPQCVICTANTWHLDNGKLICNNCGERKHETG